MILYDKPFPGCESKTIYDLPTVYYKPEKIIFFGKEFIREPYVDDIIIKTFITDGTNRYGYFSGLKSLNDLHGTTQVPSTIDIKSERIIQTCMYVDGLTKYIVHPANKIITSNNYIYLQILDTLEEMYDYFEEDRIECIKHLVDKLKLNIHQFYKLLPNYSTRTKEVIKNVFTPEY